MSTIPVASLTPNDRNPRTITPAALKKLSKSIERDPTFMELRPIIVDANGVILGGNQRFAACKVLGMTELPSSWVRTAEGLTDAQRKRFVIVDNAPEGMAGEWDLDALLADWQVPDLGDLGFDMADLAASLPTGEEVDAEPQTDRAEELRQEWGVEAGQLWALGDHRMMCGDSTRAEDVARLMGGVKADLCFTSPPYGASNSAKLRDHYKKGVADRDSFYRDHADDPESWPDLMAGWFDVVRPCVAAVICNVQMLADNKRHMVRWLSDRVDDLVDVIVWDKINPPPQMQRCVLSNAFEFLFVFGGNGSRSIPCSDFHGTIQNIVRIDPHGGNKFLDVHRAVMPVTLPAWILRDLCPKASSVLDPFLGSGTTLIAAEQLGRKCYGLEISPAYCAVVLQRFQDATGKVPTLVAP